MREFNGRNASRKEAICRLYTAELMSEEIDETQLDEYALFLVENVKNRREEIDQIIEKCLVNYSIGRLNYVDQCIIRIATLEMIVGETPYSIIINEAINLTKAYTNLDDDKAKAFNNRLLDNISKYLKEALAVGK